MSLVEDFRGWGKNTQVKPFINSLRTWISFCARWFVLNLAEGLFVQGDRHFLKVERVVLQLRQILALEKQLFWHVTETFQYLQRFSNTRTWLGTEWLLYLNAFRRLTEMFCFRGHIFEHPAWDLRETQGYSKRMQRKKVEIWRLLSELGLFEKTFDLLIKLWEMLFGRCSY